MSQLILISALEDGVTSHELVSDFKATFSVHKVWMDPFGEPRAVVFCNEKLELRDIKMKLSIDSTVKLTRCFDIAQPTTSVFVKTYNSITFGTKDKLKYLFTSKKYGGRKVVKVEQLNLKDDDCYELFFLNWGDVLEICNVPWKVEKQTLTVIPFFDSFREPFKQQFKRLLELNNTASPVIKDDTRIVSPQEAVSIPSVMLKPSEKPSKMTFPDANDSVEAVHNSAENRSESQKLQRTYSSSSSMSSVSDFTADEDKRTVSARKQTYPHTGNKGDLKSAKPVLEHPYILALLHLLKFEDAVQQKYNMVTVTICESNWDVEIAGPVASLKIIQKLLTEEDELDHSTQIETFLGNEAVLQELKIFIDNAGLYVDIVDTQGKPFLQVRDDAERKETFHDFIFSLVISKECTSLPSIECQKHTEWTKYLNFVQGTYTYQRIYVEDTSVTLICLVPKSQNMDIFVNIINSAITQLKRDSKPDLHRDESVPNPKEIFQNMDESSQSSGSTTGKESSKCKKITLCSQNPVLLWILKALNLKNSLRHLTNNLDVDIDEEEGEIFIRGSKEFVQKLKSVLLMEDKKFQFTEDEQTFLCDQIIQESLNSCLISHGCYIVLSEDLELFVASKDGHKTLFRNFLTSFIQFKTVSDLPENYQQTKEWNSLVEHCKNNFPHHHILTADDKVFLLTIAPDEANTDAVSVLKEIDRVIKLLALPEFPEKLVPLAEEISDQKCEAIKTGSREISATEKMKKVTLYHKQTVLVSILKSLQLKKAAEQFGVSVTIHTDHEIIMEGPKNTVKGLQSVLIKEDNEMLFGDQEEFLTDERIQQSLDSYLKESRAHLVFDDNLGLFVGTKSGEKVQFRNFLTSFLQFKKVFDLPENYKQTKEWNSLVEHCKNKYPHQHILTADDKVYLLSIAPDEENTDAVSILKEMDRVITFLASHEVPVKHVPSAEAIGDKKCEEIKIDSGKISAVDRTKKVTLYCKHAILVKILESLQLKEAAQRVGLSVTIPTDHEIIIEGPRNTVRSLQPILIKEDNEMPFEDQEEFFTNPRVLQDLETCLKDSRSYLILDADLKLFVVNKSGEKERFRTFIKQFIKFQRCTDMPEKFQNDTAWKLRLQQFEKQYPRHHILINGEEVFLLTIASGDESHEAKTILQRINKAIADSCLPHGSEISDEDEHHDLIFKSPKIKQRYLNVLLSKELQDINDRWKSCRSQITFNEDSVQISSSSHDATNEIASEFRELLSRIEHVKIPYNFPSLSTYLNSKGLNLIQSLSDEYKCLIEVPDPGNTSSSYLSLNEEQTAEVSQGLLYKVIFIGTARCRGFNIHLVQGNMDDLKLDMKIRIQPSEIVEGCQIRCQKSSKNVVIELPSWAAPNEGNYSSHVEELRNSFNGVVSVAIEQALAIKQYDLAFSTARLTETEYPFPVSVLAKGIIEMLFEKIDENLASSQSESTTVDVYICDPGNEAVFKAFMFFLKLRYVYFGPPSQDAWNSVCFPDSYTYPDFNNFKSRLQIEVLPRIPLSLGNNTCVFYPIHPTLEVNTCPALKEHIFAEKSLKSSLSDLQHQNPDGLLAGEIAPLKGFQDGRNSFVYCSPDWGKNCDKTIERILENCIKKSAHSEVLYIVPPGMQMLSKYPVEYLAQIFFRKLDVITQSHQLLERTKKLCLLVQDPSYRKVFEQELKKRYPSKEKEKPGIIESFWNFFGFGEKDDNTSFKSTPKPTIKKSCVPDTDVTIVGTSQIEIQNAASTLGKHLKSLMKKNSKIIPLNNEETNAFRNSLKQISSNIPVAFSFMEFYELEGTKKQKKKAKNTAHTNKVKLAGSSLEIKGLCPSYLDQFMIMAGLIRDTKKDVKKINHESVEVENTAPLKDSTKTSKSEDCLEGSSKQQKKDSKLPQHGCMPKTVRVPMARYKWMREADSDDSFQDIGLVGNEIEAAYTNNDKDFQSPSGKFTFVNFASMTVHKNEAKTGVIRIEVLGEKSCSFRKPKLEKVKEDSKDFKQVMGQLQTCIDKHNLSLMEILKVEKNNSIHARCNEKSAKLKHKDYKWMWHRTSSKYKTSVFRYGFHPCFSEMPDAKHLGEGVLFFEDPDKCFNPETEGEKEIHLVHSMVFPGKSGLGAQGLRHPPLDETTGECFDSVSEDGACMIFSDAQAYPDYLVTLKV